MKDSGDRLAAFNKKRRAGMTPEAKKVRVCDNSVDGQSVMVYKGTEECGCGRTQSEVGAYGMCRKVRRYQGPPPGLSRAPPPYTMSSAASSSYHHQYIIIIIVISILIYKGGALIGQKGLFSPAFNSQIRPNTGIIARRIIFFSSQVSRKTIRTPPKNQDTRNCRGAPGGPLIATELPSCWYGGSTLGCLRQGWPHPKSPASGTQIKKRRYIM